MQNEIRTAIFVLVIAALAACGSTPGGNQSNNAPTVSPTPAIDLELQKQIAEIAKDAKGKVGVYAQLIETRETVSLNANERFAMQSVVKLPISLAVLKMAQEGMLDLDENIGISKDELVPSNMRSPIRDKNPNGGEMTVRELIRHAISESDGTAADVLQRVAGGAKGVQAYVDSIGVREMEIKHSHKEFGAKWELQYENWASPQAAVGLLKLLNTDGNASVNECADLLEPGAVATGQNVKTESDTLPNGRVSTRSVELLLQFMTESNNPANRLKGLLPLGTLVAHKTGTGGTQKGITSATNDVGVITLPNDNHIAIAVFVGDSSADLAKREGVIARIAKAIWDKWSRPKNSENTNGVTPANFSDRHTLN